MNWLVRVAFLLLWVWPVPVWAQARIDNLTSKPVATKHGLKGPVKKLTQTQSPITNKPEDWLDGYSGQNYVEEYDRQGYLQKRIAHDDANKPRSATYYKRDAKGRVTSLRIEELAPGLFSGRTEGRIDYEYDDAHNAFIVRDNRTIMGKALRRRTESVRDTVNRTLTTRTYQQDTLLTEEQRYWWDKYGYVAKQISRYRNLPSTDTKVSKEDLKRLLGSLSEKEERVLDSLTRAQDSLQTQPYKNRPEWTVDSLINQNQYDQQGRLVYQASYRGNRPTHSVRYAYGRDVTQVVYQSFDRDGNLTSENTSRQHPVDRHILTDHSRSKVGDKWETQTFNYENSPKPVYQYRYDTHGNWIEQKPVDAAGKQNGVALVRTIEYY